LRLASIELERVVEGAVGLLLLAVALGWAAALVGRRWQARRAAAAADPGVPALARFDTEIRDAPIFGGGALAAQVRRRMDTVAYGYLAVAEEYVDAGTGASWCTLTVSLPGRVPFLVADHWQALGQPGVPLEAPLRPRLHDPSFDSAYVIGAEEPGVAERVLTPLTRQVLLREPLQRLAMRGSVLLLRTFDGARLDEQQIAALGGVAARFLSSTPSFVQSSMAVSGPLRAGDPLPEGLYGPDGE
jgi:hypothetical protein